MFLYTVGYQMTSNENFTGEAKLYAFVEKYKEQSEIELCHYKGCMSLVFVIIFILIINKYNSVMC